MCVCVSSFVKCYPIKFEQTPLFLAAAEGHFKVVQYLVTEAKVNPNQPDKVFKRDTGRM